MHPQILVLSTACCAFFRRSSSCGSLGPWVDWQGAGLLELLGANKELSFAKESTNHHSHIIHVWYIDLHLVVFNDTPLKFNSLHPEIWCLEDYFPFGKSYFFRGYVKCLGCIFWNPCIFSICTATWFTTCVFCYGNMDICILYILYPCTLILF